MTTWLLKERAGRTTVTWGRKTKTFNSEKDAQKFFNENRGRGDQLLRVEDDGYRVPVERRRWRQRS